MGESSGENVADTKHHFLSCRQHLGPHHTHYEVIAISSHFGTPDLFGIQSVIYPLEFQQAGVEQAMGPGATAPKISMQWGKTTSLPSHFSIASLPMVNRNSLKTNESHT